MARFTNVTDRRTAWLLAALVFLVHVPFFGLGPGLDPDAWRMVAVGREWFGGHGYVASRLPGYPLMEALLGATTRAGFQNAHIVIALITSLGAVAFFRLFRRITPSGAAVAALALALHPVFVSATIELMDYGISVPLLAGSLFLAASGRHVVAGVALGVATGFRFNYALYLPALLIAAPSGRVRLTLVALITGIVAMLPTLTQNGMAAFATIVGQVPLPAVADLGRGLYHVGIELVTIPIVAVAIAFLARTPKPGSGPLERAGLVGAAIAFLTYLRHPAEIEYLLPLLLFIPLAWPGLWRGRRAWILLAAVLIGHAGVWAPRPDRPLRVWPGYVGQRIAEQREREAHVAALVERGREAKIVTILAPLLPILDTRQAALGLEVTHALGSRVFEDPTTGSLHTYLLTHAQLDSLRGAGYDVWSSEYAVPLSISTRSVNLYQTTTVLPATATKR